MAIDLNQIMGLLQNPQVQQMLKGLLSQFANQGGQGGQANLSGLMEQLQKNGMGDQLQSWVGTGPNQPITGEQMQQAIGTDTLDQIAASAGVPPEKAASELASVLPQMVNAATPNGQMPDPADVQQLLSQLLGSK